MKIEAKLCLRAPKSC